MAAQNNLAEKTKEESNNIIDITEFIKNNTERIRKFYGPDENLQNAIKHPVELTSDVKKMAYDAFHILKSYSIKIPNIGKDRPIEPRGLSVFIMDMNIAHPNIYNNDKANRILGKFSKKPSIKKGGLRELLDQMIYEDYAVVIDAKTGYVEMCKARIEGSIEIADPEGIFNGKFNGRGSAGVIASYFGPSITVRNSTGEVFALYRGKILEVTDTRGNPYKPILPLKYVPEGVKTTIPDKI